MYNMATLKSGLKKLGEGNVFCILLLSAVIAGGVYEGGRKKLELMLLGFVEKGTISLFEMKEVYRWSTETARGEKDVDTVLAWRDELMAAG